MHNRPVCNIEYIKTKTSPTMKTFKLIKNSQKKINIMAIQYYY